MRVLHLIDANAPWGGPCAQRLAADVIVRLRSPEFGGWAVHDVLMIGGRNDAIAALDRGLHVRGTIQPVGARHGRTLGARRSLECWLREATAAGVGPAIVHSWTTSTGALAALAAPGLPRVVTMHPMAVDQHSPHIRPRDQVREHWLRTHGVALDHFVLGFIGEPPERFDARQAMHVGARTGLSSRRIIMVMSGRTFGRAEQHRCLAQLGLDHSVIQEEAIAHPWEIAAGLDAALVLAPMRGQFRRATGDPMSMSSMPALWAIAAGVPIIAESHAPLCGLVTHERTGLVVPPGDMNQACDRLLRLYDDRPFARRLTDAARSEAERRFSMRAFCARVNDAYRRALVDNRAEYLDMAALD